jgi:hypothetical protein
LARARSVPREHFPVQELEVVQTVRTVDIPPVPVLAMTVLLVSIRITQAKLSASIALRAHHWPRQEQSRSAFACRALPGSIQLCALLFVKVVVRGITLPKARAFAYPVLLALSNR